MVCTINSDTCIRQQFNVFAKFLHLLPQVRQSAGVRISFLVSVYIHCVFVNGFGTVSLNTELTFDL